MSKLFAWGITATLAIGLVASTGRAGDDDATDEVKPAAKPSGFQWSPVFLQMIHADDPKPPPKKPASPPKKETPSSTAAPAKPVHAVNDAAAERAREEGVLMRRLQVCDKLTEIALRTNDTELLHRAEALDERARTTYSQRTAYLRGAKGTADKAMASDIHTTSRPATAAGTGHDVTGTDAGNRAAIKEVNQ